MVLKTYTIFILHAALLDIGWNSCGQCTMRISPRTHLRRNRTFFTVCPPVASRTSLISETSFHPGQLTLVCCEAGVILCQWMVQASFHVWFLCTNFSMLSVQAHVFFFYTSFVIIFHKQNKKAENKRN